jgi:hypothetical protein
MNGRGWTEADRLVAELHPETDDEWSDAATAVIALAGGRGAAA